MKRKPLVIGIVIVAIVAIALVVLLGRGGGEETTLTPTPEPAPTPTTAPTPAEVKVPVNLKGASNLGSLQIELLYTSAVLEAMEVEAGELAKNAMIEYNLETPGRVIVGIIDAAGISGDGPVVTVSFKVVKDEGSSPITVESIEAHDATTLVDIRAEGSAGSFETKGASFTAPVITFAP